MKAKARLTLFILTSSFGSVASLSAAGIDHLATPEVYDNFDHTYLESGQTFQAVDTSFYGIQLYIGDPTRMDIPSVNELIGPAELILYDATDFSSPIELLRSTVVAQDVVISGLTTFHFDTAIPTTIGTRYFVVLEAADGFGVGLRRWTSSTYDDGSEAHLDLRIGVVYEANWQRDLSFAILVPEPSSLSLLIVAVGSIYICGLRKIVKK